VRGNKPARSPSLQHTMNTFDFWPLIDVSRKAPCGLFLLLSQIFS
jgi:hypothetical protein